MADVVSANAEFAASALLALEVNNDFLSEMRQKGKEPFAALNEKQKVIQLESTSECLQAALDRLLGTLHNKFSKGKSLIPLMHKTIPTKVKEQTALEEEALEFLLENEEKEKKQLQQALQVTTNKGRAYHEVQFKQKHKHQLIL